MTYDGLLLDFDGVVVSVLRDEKRLPSFQAAIDGQFGEANVGIDDAVIETLAHSVSPETLSSLSNRTGIPQETLWRYRDDALANVLCRAAREGTKTPYADVGTLTDLDVPVGIASNNQRRVIESILETHELSDYFETIRAREPTPASLQRKKPEPTYLEEAMADLTLTNPLYVGDKESDVLAGRRAGLDTALIRREHNATREIATDPTVHVWDLGEVVGLFEG